jgi:hypothetical protein
MFILTIIHLTGEQEVFEFETEQDALVKIRQYKDLVSCITRLEYKETVS